MVGYPESLTDPSYAGQILVLTYPLIGSYGVPKRPAKGTVNPAELPREFESYKIHVAGLVVSNYSGAGDDFSNHAAYSELAEWLKEEGIPAVCGIDTRDLTKKLRERGSTVGRLSQRKRDVPYQVGASNWRDFYEQVEYHDPNADNLVAAVTTPKPVLYSADAGVTPLQHPSGRSLRVICVDVGMKYNQIRCFTKRGVELKVVPYDYNYLSSSEEPFDGLFISNGPGDPATLHSTTELLAKALDLAKFPIFGICLGHQLMARASGANTLKLKYGNRGANIPCTSLVSGRCYITSQNHGYAVDTATLQKGWKELFVNANDSSNEGIYSTERPFFSVQFHPESAPGPRDTEFLFDVFISAIQKSLEQQANCQQLTGPVTFPGGDAAENAALTPRVDVRKVLVLGSGGLSIGQAGEFDYSGSQAIKALKEEGIYTILLNRKFRDYDVPATNPSGKLTRTPFLQPTLRPSRRARVLPTRSTSCPSRPTRSARSSSTSAPTVSTSPSVVRRPFRSVSSSRTSSRVWASRFSVRRSRPSSRPRTVSSSRTPWRRSASTAPSPPPPRRSSSASTLPTTLATRSFAAPLSLSVVSVRASPTTRRSSSNSAPRLLRRRRRSWSSAR